MDKNQYAQLKIKGQWKVSIAKLYLKHNLLQFPQFTCYTINEKGGKPDKKSHTLLYGVKKPIQKPQV
jgi:hypothetical protein